MAEKQITTNQLAKMIKKSFDSVDKKLEHFATKEELKKIASKEDIKDLSKKLDSLNDNLAKNNKLEVRVDYIENILAIKK